jgi:hypothetical protein
MRCRREEAGLSRIKEQLDSGIEEPLSPRLESSGANVIAASSSEETLRPTEEEREESGGRVH